MKPIHCRIARAAFPLAALALPFATSCSSKVEDNTVFKAQVERIDRAEKDVDAIRRQLSVMDRDLQQVSVDVSTIAKKSGSGDPQMVAGLQQRLDKIEATMKSVGDATVAFDGRIAKLEKSPPSSGSMIVASAAPLADKADSKTEPKTETKASLPSKGTESGKTSLVVSRKNSHATTAVGSRIPTASSSAVAVSASASEGFSHGSYHQVGVGETIEQIARNFKVTPAMIAQANGLPTGRPLIPGQSVYVPAAH